VFKGEPSEMPVQGAYLCEIFDELWLSCGALFLNLIHDYLGIGLDEAVFDTEGPELPET
jgi:hypothetical protein